MASARSTLVPQAGASTPATRTSASNELIVDGGHRRAVSNGHSFSENFGADGAARSGANPKCATFEGAEAKGSIYNKVRL